MNYREQLNVLVNYFKNSETPVHNFKIGIENEHFILHKNTHTAVSYYEDGGIEDILTALSELEWVPQREGNHIVGLKKDGMNISLEPGGQIEISIDPQKKISLLEKLYLSFIADISPVLEERGKTMITAGYHPVSSIHDIPFIPKQRYKYMADYFKDKGKYAHHMMKGTASIHVNLDYSAEDDYIKKCRIANYLAPVIYTVFASADSFEGKEYSGPGIRWEIWRNCDRDRCYIVDRVFNSDYGYRSYAEFLLSTPPIIIKRNNKFIYTKEKLLRDIFNPDEFTREEVEHILTMVFPGVRTKGHLEIRMGDALPYPLNLGYAAFWKGLLYDENNLAWLYARIEEKEREEILQLREGIYSRGLNADIEGQKISDFFAELIARAGEGLSGVEAGYINVLEDEFLC